MKWKAPTLPSYENGSIKTEIRFAWFPKRVGETYVWLHRYEVSYIYQVNKVLGVMNAKPVEVLVKQWFKVEERAL